MAQELKFFKSNIVVPNIFDMILFKHRSKKSHPDRMPCDGIICFCGEQGSGKTLSAVHYVYNLAKAYPKSIICTNVALTWDLPNEVIAYTSPEQMLALDNGEFGIIFFWMKCILSLIALSLRGWMCIYLSLFHSNGSLGKL